MWFMSCLVLSRLLDAESSLKSLGSWSPVFEIVGGVDDIRRSLDPPSGRTQSSKRKSLAGYFQESIKLITMSGCRESSKIYSSSSENKYALNFMSFCVLEILCMLQRRAYLLIEPGQTCMRPDLLYTSCPCRSRWQDKNMLGSLRLTNLERLCFSFCSLMKRVNDYSLQPKILEGTRYVVHPNGYAMFIVNIDDPSLEPFLMEIPSPLILNTPLWGRGRYCKWISWLELFVFEDGLLAFMWKES